MALQGRLKKGGIEGGKGGEASGEASGEAGARASRESRGAPLPPMPVSASSSS